jgi:hypothetical protein
MWQVMLSRLAMSCITSLRWLMRRDAELPASGSVRVHCPSSTQFNGDAHTCCPSRSPASFVQCDTRDVFFKKIHSEDKSKKGSPAFVLLASPAAWRGRDQWQCNRHFFI